MRISHVISEFFTKYKIEKWNDKKECWEFLNGYLNITNASFDYNYLLDNCI